ncbi:MAG: very short patch repair endonuclease [Candidatus Binataceae bacterium]
MRQKQSKKRKAATTTTAKIVALKKPSAARSATMRAVRSRDTMPERRIRSLIHRLGFRFRLYQSNLPGKPDLVFPARRKAIFVHGCFWHGHRCARGSRVPKTNRSYWLEKIGRNRARDRRARDSLRRIGWKALVVWECALRNRANTEKRLRAFLGRTPRREPGVPQRSPAKERGIRDASRGSHARA